MKQMTTYAIKVLILSGVLLNLPCQALIYDRVVIGNANNLADVTGFGAVDYTYRIGKYEVTIGQYTEFLNAVAATDPYGLYHSAMAAITNVAGISRSGSSGNYTYTVMNNGGPSDDRPISSVSWFDAARFANWLANGQPTTHSEEGTTTEDGAYTLNGAVSGNAVSKNALNINTGAAPLYYIPTENEWYKAAYYDGAGGYTLYATQSSTLPGNTIGASANQANYLSELTGYCVTQSPDFSITQNYLTDVGAFSSSSSHYGTFDQTGGVWEWNDLDEIITSARGLRGGAYTSTPPYLQSTYRMGYAPSQYNANGGFRLASPA